MDSGLLAAVMSQPVLWPVCRRPGTVLWAQTSWFCLQKALTLMSYNFFTFKVLCFMILKVLWLDQVWSQGWLCEDEQQANAFDLFPWTVTECSWLKLEFASKKGCLCFIVPCFKIINSLTEHQDASSTSSIYFFNCFYFGAVYSYSLHYYARILYKIYLAKKPNLMSF